MNKTRAVRHVYLVRHGQYVTRTKFEDQKQLTELGLNKICVKFSFYHKIFR